MKSNSKHKVSALTKKGVAMFIAAALMALIALFGITACPNNVEGGAVTGTANGGNTGGLKWHEAPFVEGGASLILSPDKLTIRVTVTTSDNSPITVEGCDKTELTSGTRTELKAKGTKVVLKGKITKLKVGEWNSNDSNKLTALNVQGLSALEFLYCNENQLTSLNTQGCTALKTLSCGVNQLTADAFTKLFNDLPQRTANAGAECHLYTEQSGVTEGNHKDFTAPPDLAAAFNKAKTVKKWKMSKYNGSWSEVVI